MFRKKSRLFWGFAFLLFFIVDLFLLWKVGIVSLGDLDAFRDMNFGQSNTDALEDSKKTVTKKKFEKKQRLCTLKSLTRKKSNRKSEKLLKAMVLIVYVRNVDR